MAGRDAPIANDGAAAERIYRMLLGLYPTAFRVRYGDEMAQLFSDQLRDARTPHARSGPISTWFRMLGDLSVTATLEHLRGDRGVGHSIGDPPSTLMKILGALGILGGVALLLPFLVGNSFDGSWFDVRLPLYHVGVTMIVAAVLRRELRAAPRLAVAGALPAILANGWILLIYLWDALFGGAPGPSFGLGQIPYHAMAIGDAWFGFVVIGIGVMSRWSGLALMIGSILMFTGNASLGLTHGDFGWFFDPISQVGAVAHGVAWVALGVQVVRGRGGRPVGSIRPSG